MRRLVLLATLGLTAGAVSGCVVASAAGTVVSTTVSVAGTAVSTTADVVGAGVGAVVGDGDDE